MQPAVFADVVHPGDVVVIEPGGRLGLVLKPLQGVGVGGLFGRKDLQRDGSAQLGVDGAEHAAHPAAADVFDQLEMPQPVAGHHPAFEDAVGRVGGRRRSDRRATGDDRRRIEDGGRPSLGGRGTFGARPAPWLSIPIVRIEPQRRRCSSLPHHLPRPHPVPHRQPRRYRISLFSPSGTQAAY